MSSARQPSRADLRRLAESQLKARQEKAGTPPPRTADDDRRLLHELRVHQIELEMQNDELTQARNAAEEALRQLADLYDHAPVGYVNLDREGNVRTLNLPAARLLGGERARLVGRPLESLVQRTSRRALTALVDEALATGEKTVATLALLAEGEESRHFQVEAVASETRQECRLALVDVTAAKRTELERERLITQLRAAQAEVKTLRGLLPICSSCKKIRDDEGEWRPVENYIQTRTEATFTHGMCPTCMAIYYPDIPPVPPETRDRPGARD